MDSKTLTQPWKIYPVLQLGYSKAFWFRLNACQKDMQIDNKAIVSTVLVFNIQTIKPLHYE